MESNSNGAAASGTDGSSKSEAENGTIKSGSSDTNGILVRAYTFDCIESESNQDVPNSLKKAFELKIDVSNFSLKDLQVNKEDNFVVIQGLYILRRNGDGFLSRPFIRRYEIPEGVKPEDITCRVTPERFLIVSAPAIIPETPVTIEKEVPITPVEQSADASFSIDREMPY